jgi:hypothetical protein
MSTISVTTSAGAIEHGGSARAGLFRRILDAIAAAREQEAERKVAAHLAAMSEQRLGAIGFSPAEIGSIRAGEPIGNILARRAGQLA